MKDKSKLTAIILVILTVVVVIVTFIIEQNKKEEKDNDISIVTNASNFYTVNSCLYRTITYISSEDEESLLFLLPEEYKEKNGIKQDNVLDLFFDVSETSTFVSQKMYYEILSNNLTKYYVQGYVQENEIMDDSLLTKKDYDSVYFIVYLDSNENIFSIEPYDGKIFKEGLDER